MVNYVTRWLRNILATVTSSQEKFQMKQKIGSVDTTHNFMNKLKAIRDCSQCGNRYIEGVLDFKSEDFICPVCDDRKEK